MAYQNSFIDKISIFIKAGDGGDGASSFRREKFVPHGGPDGGDGGRGGDVILVANRNKSTLLDFKRKRHFRAQNGAKGTGRQMTGASGDDLRVEVPLGTVAMTKDGQTVLGEVVEHGQELILAKGGKGGLGNLHFVTSTHRAPTETTQGEKNEGFWITLELKILADVAIVGLPNAGKSTLISAITRAKSKSAEYPFTTLHPQIGVLQHEEHRTTIADIPGLIKGAHQGTGLGIEFLRHIERTRALVYLVEAKPDQSDQMFEDFRTVQREIECYDENILRKPYLIAINKIDVLSSTQVANLQKDLATWPSKPVMISARTHEGLDQLTERIKTCIT